MEYVKALGRLCAIGGVAIFLRAGQCVAEGSQTMDEANVMRAICAGAVGLGCMIGWRKD